MSSSKERQRRPVPKFTSFKPKEQEPAEPETRPAPPAEAQKGKDRREPDRGGREGSLRHSERDRDRGRDRDRKKDRERHHSRHSRDHKHRPPSPDQPRQRSTSSLVKRDAYYHGGTSHNTSKNEVFFVDKRGDPLLYKYGNDRAKVPEYHRYGGGKVLGSPGFLSISYAGSREEFTIRSRYREGLGPIFRDKSAVLKRTGQRKTRRIIPVVGAAAVQSGEDDFIALEPPTKRRKRDEGDGEFPMPDYRSIHGKAKAGEYSDTEDGSGNDESSSEDEGPADMSAAKRRSIELTRQVRDYPDDIGSWLELISLQDALFHENQDAAETQSVDAAKGLADLKLSLYEEALPHAVSSSDKERILDGLMREGSKVWDLKTLAKRWEKVGEKEGRDSFLLWKSRLNSELTHMATFTFEGLRDFILGRLRYINASLSKASDEDAGILCGQLIYVFLRLTRFVHDSGYSELAVAAWQATLELNLFRPQTETTLESALSSFADYWESEAPRLGEPEFKSGWKEFVESLAMADPPEPKPDSPWEATQTRDPFKAWAAAEQHEARKAQIPARTLDEGTVDDPFRVVMFSDIKDLLVWIPGSVLSKARGKLFDAFLTFCRLPTAGLSKDDRKFAKFLMDPFVAGRGQAFELAFEGQKYLEGLSPVPEENIKKEPEFRQHGGDMALTQDVLFAGPNWFQYLGNWSTMKPLGFDDEVDNSWVLGTLRQLVRNCGIEELAEYYLALEWRNDSASARKVAKALLKQFSANTRLYNAYALIEAANRNLEVAEKVLSSATGHSWPDEQMLWNTWAWIYLEAGQNQLALLRLCSSVDHASSIPQMDTSNWAIPPALLLKTHSHFSSTRDYSLSSLDFAKAVQHAESLALLEYLFSPTSDDGPASSSQGNINAALENIWTFCSELTSLKTKETSFYHECLLQTAARLLYLYTTRGPYRPTYVRSELARLVDAFPHNTLFLELYAWANRDTVLLMVNDPVRDVLRRSLTVDGCQGGDDRGHELTTRRFAIQYEAGRAVSAGATMMSSTKAAFEAALGVSGNSNSVELRGNVDLWVCFIRVLQGVYHSVSAARRGTVKDGDGKAGKTGKTKGREKERERDRGLVKEINEVYYRGIAACPWSKRLYMEAFGSEMVKEMDSSDLRAVVNTLGVKGLRGHVDLEEFMRRWEREGERRGR